MLESIQQKAIHPATLQKLVSPENCRTLIDESDLSKFYRRVIILIQCRRAVERACEGTSTGRRRSVSQNISAAGAKYCFTGQSGSEYRAKRISRPKNRPHAELSRYQGQDRRGETRVTDQAAFHCLCTNCRRQHGRICSHRIPRLEKRRYRFSRRFERSVLVDR